MRLSKWVGASWLVLVMGATPARADEGEADARRGFRGHVEVGHVMEQLDLAGATYSTAAYQPGEATPAPREGSQLGIRPGFAAGISVNVEARMLGFLTWSIFGWDLLAANPNGLEVELDGVRARATTAMHLRMTTAPGLRFELDDVSFYGRVRASAGITEIGMVEPRASGGGSGERTYGAARFELAWEAGALVSADWVDAGLAFRQHVLGTHGWGLSLVTSFRFV
ncbi:MAG: hypothetical protein IT379_06055 [Deltaproteobacteria bacterium]|nr:hypothetical protein [Deltaproteobacteria bacterium]